MNDREPTITVDQLMEQLQFAQEQGDRRVMAERERCAKIAEESAGMVANYNYNPSGAPSVLSPTCAKAIAAKIREGA
jgi:hypothetical protein